MTATLCDVLSSRTRSLYHLIDRARARIEELLAKPVCAIIQKFNVKMSPRLMERAQYSRLLHDQYILKGGNDDHRTPK
jgi:hypothetical protein